MNDTSTRSGMLWEVERILDECKELGNLPSVLIMENVPQVHGEGAVNDFNKWQLKLEELGYKNYWEDLIATDYGIPQTRNRCFMVSILGDYSYSFPPKQELKLKLKDMLEDNVDEKYYLSDKMINYVLNRTPIGEKDNYAGNIIGNDAIKNAGTLTTKGSNTGTSCRASDNFIVDNMTQDEINKKIYLKDTENYIEWEDGKNIQMNCRAWKDDKVIATLNTGGETKILVKNNTKKGYLEAEDGDGIDISTRMEYHRGTVQKGKTQTISTMGGENNGVVVNVQTCLLKNKGTKISRLTDNANTLMARDYKGFGNQEMNAVIETDMKRELCNKLIQNNMVKENDVIRHSYTTSRNENWEQRNVEKNNISPTLDTRCDCLGVVTLGNYSPSGHNAARVVDNEHSAPTVMENHGTITATQTSDLRIRKLTPRECFRLMGVKDEDFEKVAKNQSNASLYHLAGDSIVVDVIKAILKEML